MSIKDTSRVPLLDIIEAIKNLIADKSHMEEELNNLLSRREKILKDLKESKNEAIFSVNNELKKHNEREILELEKEIKDIVGIRRELMGYILNKYKDGDDTLWCRLKHEIAIVMYLEELKDSGVDLSLDLYYGFNKIFYKTLGNFIGEDNIYCGRCLNDRLNEKDEKK